MFQSGYHVILVPKNSAKTRSFKVSTLAIRLFFLGALLALPIIFGSFMTVIYYQNQLADLKRKAAEDRQILDQKEMIAMKLSAMERVIARTEQSVNDLQKTMEFDMGEVQTGLGPISEFSSDTIASLSNPMEDMIEGNESVTPRAINNAMSALSEKVDNLQANIDEIYSLNSDKIRFVQANPSVIPVEGWITSDFGVRRSPFGTSFKMHYGLDIAAPIGTPIKAPADGVIIYAKHKGGYGNVLMIDHGYGLVTLYGHTSQYYVQPGDKVKRGQLVAAVGNSGSSTGAHLHYEVHVDGIPTDPMNFIVKR